MTRTSRLSPTTAMLPESALGIVIGKGPAVTALSEPVVRAGCSWPAREKPLRWTSRFREDTVRMALRRLK